LLAPARGENRFGCADGRFYSMVTVDRETVASKE